MNSLPAILIGGPPHSGKSVLTHSLSQALVARNCEHYVLRVAPDGEGHYSQEAEQALVQQLRVKSLWTETWIEAQCRYIAQRTLPLIVDMGGRPTPASLTLFDQCTHALLLTKDETSRRTWTDHANAHGLQVIVDLTSTQSGESNIDQRDPVLRGTLSGLERGKPNAGELFDAIVARVANLFQFSPSQLRQTHFGHAPFGNDVALIDFWELARSLYPNDPRHNFLIEDLDRILECIPADQPIAVYGRLPMWLAGELGQRCDVRWHFDARNGWVKPVWPTLNAPDATGADASILDIRFAQDASQHQSHLKIYPRDGNIDYEEAQNVVLPYLPPAHHVVVSGRIPYWLLYGVMRAYRYCQSVRAVQVQQQQFDSNVKMDT